MIVWQAFKDKLEYNAWYDPCRCNDVHVLHWLVDQGYKCLVTDICARDKGNLRTYQGLPPRDRMSLEDARTWFLNIWARNNTILDMFVELGCRNVVMLFPERSEHNLTYLAVFLRSARPSPRPRPRGSAREKGQQKKRQGKMAKGTSQY